MPNNTENLCFYGTHADKEYLPFLKGCTGGYTCFVQLTKVTTITEILMYCKPRGVTGIISTSLPLLVKLLNWTERKAPSLADYAGSMFFIGEGEDKIEIVFIAPLKNMTTVTYGKFLAKRYVSKLVKKDSWMDKIPHTWKVVYPEDVDSTLCDLSKAFLIAVDIETFKDNARIRCVSFTGFFFANGGIYAQSYVLPIDSDFNHAVLKKLCWELKAPKVFHNGKYDINYLLRFNCIPYNYAFDTINLMHSWYSELPKTLAVTNAFCMRESRYWKDMSKTQDLQEYYHYNALDTYTTGCACIYLILSMPQWALDNYYLEFPNVFPCIMAELTGIERDMDRLHSSRAEQEEIIAKHLEELRVMVGEPNFNPNSPKQVLNLIHLLGSKDIKSTKEAYLKKAMFRHPLNTRILGKIIKVRQARKLTSTYLTLVTDIDKKTKEPKDKEFSRPDGTGNRILYALNPHGTDTGRLASREHHFWAGLQIQNMPRNKSVKQTLKADPGFHFFEVDLEQAESRDTAYISGDETLIDAVENSPDFHSSNAASFFGMKFEEIYDTVAGKVIRKDLRTLGKPINHGANYNMGVMVLIDEMGEEMMYQAKALLGLPKVWSLREVGQYLLDQFHKTYPGIRGTMYKGIVSEVVGSSMLKSTAMHWRRDADINEARVIELYNTGSFRSWTRYCFGDPTKSKPQLNAYVAHPPQSLNAMTLNKAWLKVFFSITLNPKYADNVKICAQVHDSIVGQTRIGHEYIQELIAECMEIPVTVRGYDKKIRTFTVPAGVKAGREDTNNIATYWSETE